MCVGKDKESVQAIYFKYFSLFPSVCKNQKKKNPGLFPNFHLGFYAP